MPRRLVHRDPDRYERLERRLERAEQRINTLVRLTRRQDRRIRQLELEVAVLDAGAAVTASLTIEPIGDTMPGSITIDTTNETAVLTFEDKIGDPTAAPTGATVVFASDNTAVATVAADAANPFQADVTPVGLGTANISAALTGALEPDGVTAIPNPAPVAVTVSAGAADQAAFVLSV